MSEYPDISQFLSRVSLLAQRFSTTDQLLTIFEGPFVRFQVPLSEDDIPVTSFTICEEYGKSRDSYIITTPNNPIARLYIASVVPFGVHRLDIDTTFVSGLAAFFGSLWYLALTDDPRFQFLS